MEGNFLFFQLYDSLSLNSNVRLARLFTVLQLYSVVLQRLVATRLLPGRYCHDLDIRMVNWPNFIYFNQMIIWALILMSVSLVNEIKRFKKIIQLMRKKISDRVRSVFLETRINSFSSVPVESEEDEKFLKWRCSRHDLAFNLFNDWRPTPSLFEKEMSGLKKRKRKKERRKEGRERERERETSSWETDREVAIERDRESAR